MTLIRPTWYSIVTTDPDAAVAFYTELFGWTTTGETNEFTSAILAQDGRVFASVHKMPEPTPSMWMLGFEVPDTDEYSAKAIALGGSTDMAPTTLPGVGRVSGLRDSCGAAFSLWTPAPGASHFIASDPPVHGEADWAELINVYGQVRKSLDFYQQLFGWTATESQGGMGAYYLMGDGEKQVAGIFDVDAPGIVANWAVYFQVANMEEMVAATQRLGGRLLMDVMNQPGVGKIGYAFDPTGAMFVMIQSIH